MTRSVGVDRETVDSKIKLNTLVTLSHIFVTIAFSITQFLTWSGLKGNNDSELYRMYSAFYFFGGVADLFLSLMLWLILDNQK